MGAAAWVAAIAAVAGVATSGYEYATMPGPPGTPNLAQATRAGTEAEAQTLADRRRLEAAAQQGTSTLNFGYRAVQVTPELRSQLAQHIKNLTAARASMNWLTASQDQRDGADAKLALLKQQYDASAAGGTIYLNKQGKVVPKEQAFADFTGYGAADVQGKLAKQNAQNQFDLEQKYGSQFIDEALKEQQLADPEGVAARKESYGLIQQLENEHPDRPVAELLDSQVADQLHAGKHLDTMSDAVLKDAVAKAQASRGGGDSNLDFSAPLTTGLEGEQRQMAAQRKAAAWLASGQTPEDVEYRRRQAIEGDLGAFINGRTPESQFATLSGAQRGPAPYNPGQPLTQGGSGTGAAANNAALGVWGQQMNFNLNQANPWFAGLSTMLRGVNAYTNSSVPRTTA